MYGVKSSLKSMAWAVFAAGLTLAPACVWGASVVAAQLVPDSSQKMPVTSAQLAGHKAVYTIQLSSTKMGASVIGLRGRMTYNFKPSCEGWIVDHQFHLTYDYTNNPSSEAETVFSSFEGYNGEQMQFSSVRRNNGELAEELRGRANRTVGDGSVTKGTARYSIPDDIAYDFHKDTIFPAMHTVQLINAAKSGKKVFNAHVFDGSDIDGPVEINAFIGHLIKAGKWQAPKGVDTSLTSVDAWPIRMAVFPENDEQSEAEYELTMTLLQNGIIKDMTVDYHDFSFTQKLISLEKITAERCGE